MTASYSKILVYQAEIEAKIKEIAEICQEHDIPFVATFHLRNDENGGAGASMAHVPPGKTPAHMMAIVGLLQRMRNPNPGGIIRD